MNELGKLCDRDVKIKFELLFTDLDGFVRIETDDNLIYQNVMSHFMMLRGEVLTEALLTEMAKGLDEIQEEREKRRSENHHDPDSL